MDSLLSKVTPSATITEHEIFLTDPSQLDDLEAWCNPNHNQVHQQQQQEQQPYHHPQQPLIHVRLAQRLFGPPRISLSWKQRCHLFQLLKKLPNLASITIHGTTMGQVISAELLSTGIPSSLCSLTMDTGLIFDQPSSVEKLATALDHHPQLRQIQLYNFLNHVRPIQVPPTWLLDPLLHALGTCPHLHTVELACLASFLEWKVPLLSSSAIQFLMIHTPQLRRLQLTNLGLTDSEFITLAETIPLLSHSTPSSSSSSSCSLQELIVNGNENTIVGLRRLILQCLSLGSTITHLEVMNHVKLTEDLYDYIVWYTERYTCPLQCFEVTFPLRIDPTILRLQLRLHQLQLASRFYSPLATTTSQLQVLGQISDDPNCLFRLLQQQPHLVLQRSHPSKLTMSTKNNHNHNHNHHDDTRPNSSLHMSRDDNDGENDAAKKRPKRSSQGKWILLPSTGGLPKSVGFLMTIILLVLVFVKLLARSQDIYGSSTWTLRCDYDEDIAWGQPVRSDNDSFPWNNNNDTCLRAIK